MANFLVLTTDLPYFPGKNGHDFFNLHYLAQNHCVGIVAPLHPFFPEAGVANLASTVDALYLWPRPANPGLLFISRSRNGHLSPLINWLPAKVKWRLLRRLLGLHHDPPDAYERLAVLANCAAQLLDALRQRTWHGLVIIQTSNRPWLDFLPRLSAKCVYFHDVRADYLRRAIPPVPPRILDFIRQQEDRVCRQADAVGFVSADDLAVAKTLFRVLPAASVAPIPLDQAYFTPRPADWPPPAYPIVLFTGHLGHPPNVDAVQFLVRDIWPRIVAACPEARLIVAGMQPAPGVVQALATAANAELHPDVPDIRPFFWNARVYAIPMRFGGGVRQKIFEAWSMRIPVVCTPMGAEGSGAVHGQHCWLEHDPAAFASRIISLLLSPPSPALLDAAAALVQRDHAVVVAGTRFDQLCQSAVHVRRHQAYRLLFDLRWMEIGRAGGTEQMTSELIHALGRLDHRNHYTAYVPRGTFHEWRCDPAFQLRPFFSDDTVLHTEQALAQLTNRLAEDVGRQPVLTPEMRTLRAWRRMDFDLVHSLNGYVHPDLHAFPHIVTVHDLQHLAYPQFFKPNEWAERDQLYRDSVRDARHIIAISEFTRQDLHRRYHVPLDRITAIWNIPSQIAWTPPSPAVRRRILARLGLTGPFLFYPAHCWPHKNHARLVEAFATILPRVSRDLRLVFTGRPFPPDHPALALMQQPALDGRVIHLGYRTPLEMQALLHGCVLLACPSLFEGFGMPVAEAIIAGKPVACSATTSLPEIAGDAAQTFDPENIPAIADSLLQCLNHPVRRAELTAAALRRRAVFSARTTAVQTLSIYRRVFDAVYR